MKSAPHLLIVEDEPNIGITTAYALRSTADRQYVITVCRSIAEARSWLTTTTVDLVISDLRLPDGSGLEFLAEVLQTQPHARTMLVTAFGTPEVEAEARQLADAYLTKPFNLAEVISLVRSLLAGNASAANLSPSP